MFATCTTGAAAATAAAVGVAAVGAVGWPRPVAISAASVCSTDSIPDSTAGDSRRATISASAAASTSTRQYRRRSLRHSPVHMWRLAGGRARELEGQRDRGLEQRSPRSWCSTPVQHERPP